MRLVDEFVEKVLNDNGSFNINVKEKNQRDTANYHFLQSKVGKARYVYGIESWNDEMFYSDVDLKPGLVAIVSEGIVYIVDDYFLKLYRRCGQEDVSLPENAKRLDEVLKETNEYVSNVIFMAFYNALDIEEISDEDTIKECRKRARGCLFSKEPTALFEDEKLDDIFNIRDIANSICGFVDIYAEAGRRLNERKSEWIYRKSINEKIRSLMKDSETAFDWEIAIAEGIRSVDAKTVNVEFEMDGKRASGKISPDTIIRILKTDDIFGRYNFEVTKQGEKVLEDLGAGNHWSEKTLKCKHITRITYGKKELYVRK